MCTSIAVYKDKPIYAINFDFFEVESRISNSGSVPAFFYCRLISKPYYLNYINKVS